MTVSVLPWFLVCLAWGDCLAVSVPSSIPALPKSNPSQSRFVVQGMFEQNQQPLIRIGRSSEGQVAMLHWELDKV
jgi:hypothetical protein